MKSTRDRILALLLQKPKLSTSEIATEIGINPISARHHLTNLQMKRMVDTAIEMHGVGRPRMLYYLTEKGLELFPSRYVKLTSRILSRMKDKLSPDLIAELFSDVAHGIADEHSEAIVGLSIESRLKYIQDLLKEEGFSIQWERKGDEYFIHEVSCPYLYISQKHPEVCVIDETLISTILSLPTNKVECKLAGSENCTFVVKP